MKDRAIRRELTEKKIKQREQLAKDLGLQQGSLYEKHREKIGHSAGYMRDGNVSHFVAVDQSIKTKNSASNQTYGARHNYSAHDLKNIEKLNDEYAEDFEADI